MTKNQCSKWKDQKILIPTFYIQHTHGTWLIMFFNLKVDYFNKFLVIMRRQNQIMVTCNINKQLKIIKTINNLLNKHHWPTYKWYYLGKIMKIVFKTYLAAQVIYFGKKKKTPKPSKLMGNLRSILSGATAMSEALLFYR